MIEPALAGGDGILRVTPRANPAAARRVLPGSAHLRFLPVKASAMPSITPLTMAV